jgi:uncharacterized protein YndB with AHSA1/START domain
MSIVKQEKLIKASPEEVYRYFTNSTALKDWMCEVATADPHPGGHLFMGWTGEYYTAGEYLRMEANKSVSFTWFGKGEPHKTRVDVTLKKARGGTRVKLTHRGMGKGEKWANIADVYAKEWQNSFENLASVLESGADLRITRRPMIGIFLGDFDASIAVKLGCPVDFGTRLEGVLDGMGAQKAGLQKDDVITAVDGHELTSGSTLTSVLGTKHAGDVVEVTYYRGAEKKNVQMTLTGRTIPTIPSTTAEFSKEIAKRYQDYENEIEKIISDASEAECSHKPAPTEWSANEVLAHLIQGEQGWLNYSSEIVGGNEGAYDEYSGNMQARIDATTDIYPTKGDLFNALKERYTETIRFLTHLPKDTPTHKGRWWKLVYIASQDPIHFNGHMDQMRAAIQSAKGK